MDKGQAGAIQARREGEVMAGTDHATQECGSAWGQKDELEEMRSEGTAAS